MASNDGHVCENDTKLHENNPYTHLFGTELVRGEWEWDADRALLYAVGVGAGLPYPLLERQFTTENTPGSAQQVLPTFLTLMNLDSDWLGRLGWEAEGLSPIGMVHGEQSVALARPIPPAGKASIRKTLRGVWDKGSGALVVMDTEVRLADTGELLGTTTMKLFAQGKGGFGGPRNQPGEPVWERPSRAPDDAVTLPVGLNQSLIYRLSGDKHPHGTDPGRARADGFDAPIFYGLGTYGLAARALIMALCDGDAARFGAMDARFSRPVYPGDDLTTRIWRTDDGAQFETVTRDNRVVLDRGTFAFRRPPSGTP